MPKIRAFRGWRYNTAAVENPADVVAPPYDVITPAEQEALHRRSPYNVVRLILGRRRRTDSGRQNRNTRAAAFMRSWMSKGILVRDAEPCVYVYVQDYRDEGRARERIGFMAAMRLDEKSVLRHEKTLAAPKRDRMALLKEVRANLSPVFGLFEDPRGRVQKALKRSLARKPDLDVTLEGVRHRLFVERYPERISLIQRDLRSRPLFIADGHHRFEVARQFRDWMLGRRRFTGEKGEADWNYVLTYFCDCRRNPFRIFPTHRLIRLPKGMDPLERLARRGVLTRASGLRTVLSKLSAGRGGRYGFGIYAGKRGFYHFTLDAAFAPGRGANVVERLDVAVLHQKVLRPCFGIEDPGKSDAVAFTRDARAACRSVRSGRFDLAIFLKAASLDEMIRVSKRGLAMPQKSTYFYPKLLSGLVFHKFEKGVG